MNRASNILIALKCLVALCGLSSFGMAAPLGEERLAALPPEVAVQWKAYLDRSREQAAVDARALEVELATLHLERARPAPEGGDFKIPTKADDAWFVSDEGRRLAEVILSYQTPSGGWSKHSGYSKGPREAGSQWSSQSQPGEKPHYLGTFDNRSTTEQIAFLARFARLADRRDCEAAVVKGLEYILKARFPNGGWPQVYPLEGGYHDCITYNDDAMVHILELLRRAGGPDRDFAFVGAGLKARLTAALNDGIRCVILTQVRREGVRTGWCAQHDAISLEPEAARKMEPAALSGTESAAILDFLMTVPDPSPELVEVIESGLGWLERARIDGVGKVERDGRTFYVADPSASRPLWARFYALADGRPVFPGRDGVIYQNYEEMAQRNALGYDYYSSRPASTLGNGQRKWRKRLGSGTGG